VACKKAFLIKIAQRAKSSFLDFYHAGAKAMGRLLANRSETIILF
jgi:hypothetical protein